MMILKIAGIASISLGLLLILVYPFLDKYQPEGMFYFSVLIGLILIGAGFFLLKI
ncbi:MAG: hypothetical protein RMJ18_02930 [Candidatus Aenigmarchaeota archaeon]|nr:hypothetical protein [Candidatus Aenigmarchaeota archaeon]MCX8191125.1 hypothetical protein [Candidatus Aenigmarchaeota archaeon]MDW8160345.1 hypothetical protein [Candidatus Aenigmarchaeota archaeon]